MTKKAAFIICFILIFVQLTGCSKRVETDFSTVSDIPESEETIIFDEAKPQHSIFISEAVSEASAQNKPEEKEYIDISDIRSECGYIYDVKNGYFSGMKGEEGDIIFPASITKLYTAVCALRLISPEETVIAGDELDFVAADSSVAFIKKGNILTAEMLIQGMLIPSGNDAAYVLAKGCGKILKPDATDKEAVKAFVDHMNKSARDDGLTDTSFMNPDGYHEEGHKTSIRDINKIALMALKNETVAKTVATPKMTVYFKSGEKVTWKNTNALLDEENKFYDKDFIGIKTGFTSDAGYCLISAFKQKGNTYIIGIFKSPTNQSRYNDIFDIKNAINENTFTEEVKVFF